MLDRNSLPESVLDIIAKYAIHYGGDSAVFRQLTIGFSADGGQLTSCSLQNEPSTPSRYISIWVRRLAIHALLDEVEFSLALVCATNLQMKHAAHINRVWYLDHIVHGHFYLRITFGVLCTWTMHIARVVCALSITTFDGAWEWIWHRTLAFTMNGSLTPTSDTSHGQLSKSLNLRRGNK